MKKLLIFVLVAAFIFGLCACGKSSGSDRELKTLAEEESGNVRELSSDGSNEVTRDEISISQTQTETEPTTLATTISQIITTTKTVITTTKPATTTTRATTRATTVPSTSITNTTRATTTTRPSTTNRPSSSQTESSTYEPTQTTTEVLTTSARTRYGAKFTFSTTDINGNTVKSEDFASAKLIMINMWEPWCGPCVGELSDLQRLYTNYKDKGFVLLGVFADNPDDAKSIVRQKGLTYPILNKTSGFDRFHTGYVPTTVFLDGEGYPLTSEPYVGSRDYSQWEQIVKSLLY